MKKRVFSLILVLCMVCTLLPFGAFAADIVDSGTFGGNLMWTLDSNGTLTISGTGSIPDYSRKYYPGMYVTTAPWGIYYKDIYKLEIESGVTSIGYNAFCGCNRLTTVWLSDSVSSIEECAFWYCSGLTSVTITASLKTVGEAAFMYCENLKSVYYTGDYKSWLNICFLGPYANPCSYGSNLYFDGVLAEEVVIPNNVTSIKDYTFNGCTSLTSIEISNSVTSIGKEAFNYCTCLTSVTIGNSVTSIGNDAFNSCYSLTSVTIGNSVTSIGYNAFASCYSLTSVTLPDSVTSIGDEAFCGCESLTSVTIPDGVTSIGNDAFNYCTCLTSVTIGNSVTSIGYDAFNYCTCLTSVTIPSGVMSICNGAFEYCSNLTDVYYTGTEAQWNAINIGIDNESLLNANIHYNATSITLPARVTAAAGEHFTISANITASKYTPSSSNLTWSVLLDDTAEIGAISVNAVGENKYTAAAVFCFPEAGVYTVTLEDAYGGKASTTVTVTSTYVELDTEMHVSQLEEVDITAIVGSKNFVPTADNVVWSVSSGNLTYPVIGKTTVTRFSTDEPYFVSAPFIFCDAGEYTVTLQTDDGASDSVTVYVKNPVVQLMLSNKKDYSNVTNNFYTLTAEVYNEGSDTLSGLAVKLELPESLTATEALTKQIGDIPAGDSKTVTWKVRSAIPQENINAIYKVALTNQTTGTVLFRQEDNVLIEAQTGNYEIIFGRDQWNFSNSSDNFNTDNYYMTQSDYATLISKMSETEKDAIDAYKESSWGGSCFGMSSVAVLSKMGVIDPSDIQTGKTSLYTITKQKRDSVESIINYYHFMQKTSAYYNVKVDFMKKSVTEQLSIIHRMAEKVNNGGYPFLLDFGGDGWGHAVVAFGTESGSYEVGGFLGIGTKKYDSRIKIYDCSNPKNSDGTYFNEDSYLYYNVGTDEWCIEHWNPTYFKYATNDIKLLNYADYGTTTYNNAAMLVYRAPDSGTDKSYAFTCVHDGKTQNIDSSTNYQDDGIVTFFDDNVMADGTYIPSNMIVILPELDVDYSIKPTDGEHCDFTMYYRDFGLSVSSDEAKRIDFCADGEMTVSGINGDYELYAVINEEAQILPWEHIEISGSNADEMTISMEQTEEGVIISGADFGNAEISLESDSTEQTVTCPAEQDSILITSREENGEEVPVIMLDTDNNGSYESEYKCYEITFDPCGGELEITSLKTNNNGKLDALPIPNRTGFIFDGWFTAKEAGEKVAVNTVFSTDTVLYAHWSLPDHIHNYVAEVTEPGCIQEGYTTNTCPICGDSYKDYFIPALGHNYIDGVCTRCGEADPNYKSPVQENPFVDVSEGTVYYDAILWAYYHTPQQITGGFTATEFRPQNPCTRAQVVTFLWRAKGCPEPTTTDNPFSDVSAKQSNGKDNPYYKAILWAAEEGITTGYAGGLFKPNDTVTRAQFVTFLWRADGKPATTGSINGFADAGQIASPYQQAVAWAVEKGITTGYEDNTFRPNDPCKRWAVVLFMYRDMT